MSAAQDLGGNALYTWRSEYADPELSDAVIRCLQVVRGSHSATNSSSRGLTPSHTGRPRGWAWSPQRFRLLQILADRVAAQPEFARDPPDTLALAQHLVSQHMHLIHPQNPRPTG